MLISKFTIRERKRRRSETRDGGKVYLQAKQSFKETLAVERALLTPFDTSTYDPSSSNSMTARFCRIELISYYYYSTVSNDSHICKNDEERI